MEGHILTNNVDYLRNITAATGNIYSIQGMDLYMRLRINRSRIKGGDTFAP